MNHNDTLKPEDLRFLYERYQHRVDTLEVGARQVTVGILVIAAGVLDLQSSPWDVV